MNSQNQLPKMPAQEIRTEIIRENIPKLIQALTGFKPDEETFQHCEAFAWSVIRNYRKISVSSHEVRRKLEGIQEKFNVENCAEYATHLGKLCDSIVRHPLCLEHYEVDIQWSLLDLLLTLPYNPGTFLRRNKQNIDLSVAIEEEPNKAEDKSDEELKEMLKEDFIPLCRCSSSDSELSNWSDYESSDKSPAATSKIQSKSLEVVKTYAKCSNLQPPKPALPFVEFSCEDNKAYLMQHIQHSWWKLKQTEAETETTRWESNFALAYWDFIQHRCYGMGSEAAPSTVSEHCLLRELIWMFYEVINCKFFHVSQTGFKVRANTTIPSVTVHGLHEYLRQNYMPHIRMMRTLRKFWKKAYEFSDMSNTLECYATNMRSLLEPICQKLRECELDVQQQSDKVNTLISLQQELRPTFKMLSNVYMVHKKVIGPANGREAHVRSTYLLTCLLHINNIATDIAEANVSAALFLAAMKPFCAIIDGWWITGNLDDWHDEFVVKSIKSENDIILGEFRNSTATEDDVYKMIFKSAFFRALRKHALEAGSTLKLLSEINRISDLTKAFSTQRDSLYQTFINDIISHAQTFTGADARDDTYYWTRPDTPELDLLSCLTTNDEHLLLAFTDLEDESNAELVNVPSSATTQKSNDSNISAFDIYEIFKDMKCLESLEDVVVSSLERSLRTRINKANSFVIQLYRDEFQILTHLRNIRKVFLFEASHLMYRFYEKLFEQIESRQEWANQYKLTANLDDMITAKYPKLYGCFVLEINNALHCRSDKVFQAVEKFHLTYKFRDELSYIIKEDDMTTYNKVFVFLLKVKWAIWTLENMRFSRSQKRRMPYAALTVAELMVRRLQHMRLWLIFLVQNLHFYLMEHVLQYMTTELDRKISHSTNLREMQMVHETFRKTISEHCFLDVGNEPIKRSIEQLFNLIYVFRLEWAGSVRDMEDDHPLALDISDEINVNQASEKQIEELEQSYIRWHQFMAQKLNQEVYMNQKSYLSGLSATFNTSLPY